MFTTDQYKQISDIVLQENYPGYHPPINACSDCTTDIGRSYAYVSERYISGIPQADVLRGYINTAHAIAMKIAIAIGIPVRFWPKRENGALRVLTYPPGAITNTHTDYHLITLMCYRNIYEDFRYSGYGDDYWCPELDIANKINKLTQFGELLEIINPKLKATPHEVTVDPLERTQHSIVHFSTPDRREILPNNVTVGDWIKVRFERSRRERTE
jgi:hypothetical protein